MDGNFRVFLYHKKKKDYRTQHQKEKLGPHEAEIGFVKGNKEKKKC